MYHNHITVFILWLWRESSNIAQPHIYGTNSMAKCVHPNTI